MGWLDSLVEQCIVENKITKEYVDLWVAAEKIKMVEQGRTIITGFDLDQLYWDAGSACERYLNKRHTDDRLHNNGHQ